MASSSSSSPPSYTTEVTATKDEKASSSRTHDDDGSPARKSEGPGGKDMKEDEDVEPRRRPRRSRESSGEDIQRMSSHQIRSSRHFDAEFLRSLAKQGGLPKEYSQEELPRFRVITGSEATEVYNNTVREDDRRSTSSHDRVRGTRVFEQRPVVFAYPGIRAGRKVVDFYMSWKGKTRAHHLKGAGRRPDILDEEFKKVIKTFDKDHRRLSKMSTDGSPLLPPSTIGITRPPTIVETESAPAVLTTAALAESDPVLKRSPLGSKESNSSVVSLPYLGAVGGGPPVNRVPLRIVNPDPTTSSTASDSRRSSVVINGKLTKAEGESPKTPVNKLPIVEEEAGSIRTTRDRHSERHKHRHRSKEASSSSPSSSSESLSSLRVKKDNPDEILIVLLDDKKAWHGLTGRRESTRSLARQLSKRVSPWSGPIANSQGEIHRYLPGVVGQDAVYDSDHQSPSSDESDSEDDDDWSLNKPVVPLKHALSALGLHSSAPPTRAPTPLAPPAHLVSSPPGAIYASSTAPYLHSSPAGTHATSLHQSPYAVSVVNLPRASTPGLPPSHFASVQTAVYPGVNASPYIHPSPASTHKLSLHQSPYSISSPNLPDSTSYVLPWVSDDHTPAPPVIAPTPSQSRTSTWPTPASVYNSPYVPAAQMPYTYTPASQPPPSLYAATPYTGASAHQPLPAVPAYVSPYVDASQQPLPPSTYPSPYVRAHTPTSY